MRKRNLSSWALLLLIFSAFAGQVHALAAYGANIVTNGDAGTGDITGWTASGKDAAYFVNSDGTNGNATKVFDLYEDATANLEATLTQTISVTSIQSDIASGLVRAAFSADVFLAKDPAVYTSGDDATARVRLEELNASDGVLATHDTTMHIRNNWMNSVAVFNGALNVSTAKLRVSLYAHTSPAIPNDYIDFDNIQLVLSTVPTVTTTSVTTFGTNSATMGGNVTSTGGASVSERGVVYSATNATPTIGGSGVTQDANGSGAGSFSKSIGSLSSGTTYYARAYAINPAGASYGSVQSFTTTATAPTISSVSAPGNGTYITGQNLDYTVNFNAPVNVVVTGGTPYIALTVGSSAVHAAYQSGSGTSALVFRYSVVAGNADADGVALSANVTLNGGTIKGATALDAILTFTGSTAAGVLVDGVAPTVSGVSAPAGGTYVAGQNLDFTATFSENVTVVATGGTPYVPITVGGVAKHADYVSGSGTSALVFRYALSSGDAGALATGTSVTLNGGTIKDGAGNSATLTFTAPTISGITIDAVAPAVSGVSAPAGGTYAIGQNLDFTATFSENVAVTTMGGTPYVPITVGGVAKHADYVSGSGTTALVFRYALSSGDAGALATGTSVTLNGGTIKDGAGNSATLTFTAPTISGITIDAVAPIISGVAAPAGGTYAIGQNLDFTATLSKAVNVVVTGGVPYMSLTIGGVSKQAAYVSGSGTAALVFRYTLSSGDAGALATGTGITLNGGTIKDGAGNSATLTFTAPTISGITIDAVAPTISGVAAPAGGTYAIGQNLDFTATLSKAVNVVMTGGVPYMSLTIGGESKQAEYVSGNGTTTLVFRYTLASGDAGALATGTGITLNGGTVKDGAGNSATLTFTAPTTTGITVDAVAPTISGMATPAGGTYAPGQDLDFTATFSKKVVVTGTPYLSLAVGSASVHALYASGSGSNALTFRYTVASGDYDVDGVALASGVTLDGGSIKDTTGNGATLTFTGSTAASVLVDARPSQTITFGALTSQTYGTTFVKLTATASSSLPVSYASGNSAVVRISNDTAYLLVADTTTITASQSGSASYLAAASVSQKMTVAKAPLIITGAVTSNKVYDGTIAATVTSATLSGVVGTDDVALTIGTASFATKDTGTAKPVSVTGSSLTGAKAGNYSLAEVSGLTANITPKPITVTAESKTKQLGSADPALTYSVVPSLAVGDAFVGDLARAPGESVDKYAITLGTLSAGGNYAITFVGADLTVIGGTTGIASRPGIAAAPQALSARIVRPFASQANGSQAALLGAGLSGCSDNSCLSLDISLPGAAQVDVSIYDQIGTPVIAWSQSFDASSVRRLGNALTLSWNLRASNGTAVTPGVYLWKVVAVTADGQKLETIKRMGVK